MSLPPGFLDELRNRVSMGQVAGRKVVWDPRKSNQGKGDLWAPCPFHQEKTASFHVDDRKGYYYCFGCHAKGDAISFVRETENVGFMEAVEILAGEAGMPMPARDPKAQEKADERTELTKVMELAVQFFRLQLKTGAGAAAYRYLGAQRGLSDDAIARWELGFAPDGWQGLWDHLTGKGVSEDQILACGLAKPSDKGRKPYDTFRNRIMFPIRDPRGRCIAFGGRAMDPNDNAKYLNSPETLLFDKGRSLYNHAPAREASGKGEPIIVAEGYMDVIALSEAGFRATVAPLGTAVTEAQLELLWRMSEEPVIALDGDKAGIRAAHRVIDLALPLLAAGKGLRFALMPDGKDPDDVIKAGGADAVREVLGAAQPMVSLLWERETQGRVFDSPERRAALDKTLREKLKLIQDLSLRGHYGEEIKRLRSELFGYGAPRAAAPGRGMGRPGGKWQPQAVPQVSTKSSFLAQQEDAESALREAVILATVATTPSILPEFEVELEDLDCSGERAMLRDALLRVEEPGVAHDVISECGAMPALETLMALPHVAITPAVRNPGDAELARLCLAEEFAKLAARSGHAKELAEAIEDIDGLVDEGLTWRLSQAAQALHSAGRQDDEDTTEYDTAPNGARLSKDEKSSFDELLGGIEFAKDRGRG